MTNMTGGALRWNIQTIPLGKQINLYGIGVRCMRPGALYQLTIGREVQPELLSVDSVLTRIASMPKKQNSIRKTKKAQPEYPADTKGISVGGAYSYLLCKGLQAYESRTKPTKHRGWTFVQVPTSNQWDESFEEWDIPQQLCPKGHIIGAIEISDCTYDKEYGLYLYHVSGALLFDTPVPNCKGKRTPIWSPGDENVVAFNKAWKYLSKALIEEENESNN